EKCCGQSQIHDPESYYRQYVGFVVNGERFLYLNAIKDVPDKINKLNVNNNPIVIHPNNRKVIH
uniref:hypothetical protein n=1 Tax=Shewanella sp. TaxID=50422 RepID=UPI004053F380